MKNGAPLPIPRPEGGSMEADSTDVRPGRLAVCDVAPSAPSTAKWRFRPSEKPSLTAIFRDFFDDFHRVFLRACPSGRQLARMRPRKAPVWNRCGPAPIPRPRSRRLRAPSRSSDASRNDVCSLVSGISAIAAAVGFRFRVNKWSTPASCGGSTPTPTPTPTANGRVGGLCHVGKAI